MRIIYFDPNVLDNKNINFIKLLLCLKISPIIKKIIKYDLYITYYAYINKHVGLIYKE